MLEFPLFTRNTSKRKDSTKRWFLITINIEMLLIVDGLNIEDEAITVFLWSDFYKLDLLFSGILFCPFQYPFCSESWETIRLRDNKNTFSQFSCRISTSRAGSFLFMIGHPTASPAESVGFGMSSSEARGTSTHLCGKIYKKRKY